ncbi:MAG: Ferric enterobactin transport ATP-binding protein FepC [Gemmatimonadaceae bacterium]|nr:Ferric enterobactin transport ATP-binding protein FepC [Gemmatimonadaceae bacterium]
MIAFDRLVVTYPRAAAPAVDDFSAISADGVFTAVVGPNGSGKSSIVRALLGRVPVTSGTISIDGQLGTSLPARERARRVAVVVQREEPAFPMAIRDYIGLGRSPSLGAWDRPIALERTVEASAAAAGVASLLGRRTDELSGGEWQRVRIARALAQETHSIVMDEPTSALDIGHEMETFELLAGLAAAGRAVLVISHQLNLVARFAQHVVVLHRGAVAASGAPDDVMRAPVLESVYDCPLVVVRDPAIGAPTLIPLRRPRPDLGSPHGGLYAASDSRLGMIP